MRLKCFRMRQSRQARSIHASKVSQNRHHRYCRKYHQGTPEQWTRGEDDIRRLLTSRSHHALTCKIWDLAKIRSLARCSVDKVASHMALDRHEPHSTALANMHESSGTCMDQRSTTMVSKPGTAMIRRLQPREIRRCRAPSHRSKSSSAVPFM